jgi:hypothetical protein
MFEKIYTLSDEKKDNMIMAIKLKTMTRQMYMFGAFFSYHIVKSVLWRYGHFAHFFYKTRFMTFPILGLGLYLNTKKYLSDLKSSGVYEYNLKKNRFEKDTYVVEKVLKNRQSVMQERSNEMGGTIKIDDLINEVKKL